MMPPFHEIDTAGKAVNSTGVLIPSFNEEQRWFVRR